NDDRDGYRRECAEAFQRLGRTTNRMAATYLCRACSLGAGSDAHPHRLVQLAGMGVGGGNGAWPLYVLGLTHYHASQHDPAVQELRQSLERGPSWTAAALNWPVLAMAHHRLGHADEARQWLERAARWQVQMKGQANDPKVCPTPLQPY